jgi:hypothetical protein
MKRLMKPERCERIAQILSLPRTVLATAGGGVEDGGTVVPGPEPTGIAESSGSFMRKI